MKTEAQIQKDIKDELRWEPILNDAELNAVLKNGHATLTGIVDSYAKKVAAENAAMRVSGVTSVSNNIEVKLTGSSLKTDRDIEKAILNLIRWNTFVDQKDIKIKVTDGWVTLAGDVSWGFQKKRIGRMVEDISGVKGITNLINVVPAASATLKENEVREKIIASFQRNYYLDADKINVEVKGHTVILSGKVRTLAEKRAAETAAWSGPGIDQVDNRIEVEYSEILA